MSLFNLFSREPAENLDDLSKELIYLMKCALKFANSFYWKGECGALMVLPVNKNGDLYKSDTDRLEVSIVLYRDDIKTINLFTQDEQFDEFNAYFKLTHSGSSYIYAATTSGTFSTDYKRAMPVFNRCVLSAFPDISFNFNGSRIYAAEVETTMFAPSTESNTPEQASTTAVKTADTAKRTDKASDKVFSDEKKNKNEKKDYLIKAPNGAPYMHYHIGTHSDNRQEKIDRLTKAAENGNVTAMKKLYTGYYFDDADSFGIDKNKYLYWLKKAAETDPMSKILLASEYKKEGRRTEAQNLFSYAGRIGTGSAKLIGYSNAAAMFLEPPGHYPDKAVEYYLKALSATPDPTEEKSGFAKNYAETSNSLSLLFEKRFNNNKQYPDLKNAAYCAVVAEALNSKYSDRAAKFRKAYTRDEYDKWKNDAKNFSFRLPCRSNGV